MDSPFQWQRDEASEEEEISDGSEASDLSEVSESEESDESEAEPSLLEHRYVKQAVDATSSYMAQSPWWYYCIGLAAALLAWGAWYTWFTSVWVQPNQELNLVLRRANTELRPAAH